MIQKSRLIKANYTNVVVSDDILVSNKIGGSASIILDDNGLPVKYIDSKNKAITSKAKVKCVVIKDFDIYGTGEILLLEKTLFDTYFNDGFVILVPKSYTLNKSKVKSKILAYAHLKKSKVFMAFYSISFPYGMVDADIRKVHNTVLTRLRKSNNKFSYIWVAERQKNGTLHFHMLTNTFFNIRIINYFYAKAIQNVLKKIDSSDINFDVKKYNGCDVEKVKSIKSLSKYLTKYVTKNNESFDGLVWNCCSLVSSLVTHLYLNEDEYKSVYSKLIYINSFVKDFENNSNSLNFDIYNYGSYRPKIIFETLDTINQYIITHIINIK